MQAGASRAASSFKPSVVVKPLQCKESAAPGCHCQSNADYNGERVVLWGSSNLKVRPFCSIRPPLGAQRGGAVPCSSAPGARLLPARAGLARQAQCGAAAAAAAHSAALLCCAASLPHPFALQDTAADCCAQCQSTPGCNVWVWCGAPGGCGHERAHRECWLKSASLSAILQYETFSDPSNPWTSGAIYEDQAKVGAHITAVCEAEHTPAWPPPPSCCCHSNAPWNLPTCLPFLRTRNFHHPRVKARDGTHYIHTYTAAATSSTVPRPSRHVSAQLFS